jgi:histidyl-tRNA synthetase
MNQPLITPRTLKGFRDFLPESMIPREHLIDTAKRVYRSYGFVPIDTPALEYEEVLTGKAGGETERQIYRFIDHGDRAVGMRFDLTVPFARFAAQHIGQLGTPFKRYHIASVWRGENVQTGRYREFMQCDFDTIGTTSIVSDIETALVIHDLLLAIGIPQFVLRMNNRKVLTGLLESLGIAEHTVAVLRSIDKLAKIGADAVIGEIVEQTQIDRVQAQTILELVGEPGDTDTKLARVEQLVGRNAIGQQGVHELRELFGAIMAAGVPVERVQLDLSIARGLDYYTGTIYETFLTQLPTIGSICSGGRYDNLAELFTKQKLPGIGASLGLDRLLTAMETLGLIQVKKTAAPVLMTLFDRQFLTEYLKINAAIRQSGIGVELYPEPKKLGQQLKFASQRGFTYALIAGADDFATSSIQVKNLLSGEQSTVSLADGFTALIRHLQTPTA